MDEYQKETSSDGLRYARSLGFKDSEYYEALKLVESPKNLNKLLVALLEVSNRDNKSYIDDNNSNFNASDKNDICTTKVNQFDNNLNHMQSTSINNNNNNNNLEQRQPNKIKNIYNNNNDYNHTKLEAKISSSSTTSCYSSITNFQESTSSNNSSLESLQLRKIYIDGSNVAKTHGRDRFFSWLGIKLCFDWFYYKQHKVKVFVPQDKCQQTNSISDNNNYNQQQADYVINFLNNLDALIKTPIGCNDDLFIIEAARQNNGIIVSNDLYRDEKRFNDELQNFIHLNRLPYIFVDDLFIPAEDPLGRTGPNLEKFLKESSTNTTNNYNNQNRFNYHHTKLSRTKSNQRYQRYSNSLNANANNNGSRSKTALYRTKSHNI